jgi:hypothetical protein
VSALSVSRHLPVDELSSNISISQAFSPARAIFAGVGALLLVFVPLDPFDMAMF